MNLAITTKINRTKLLIASLMMIGLFNFNAMAQNDDDKRVLTYEEVDYLYTKYPRNE